MTVIPFCNALRVQYSTNTDLWWLSSHCATLYEYNTVQIHFSDDCHPIVQRFTGTIQYKYRSLMTVIPLCNALRVKYSTNTDLWWLSSHCVTLYEYNRVQIQISDDGHPIVQRFTGTIQYKYRSLMTVIPLFNALRVQYSTNTVLWWRSSHCATLYEYNTVQSTNTFLWWLSSHCATLYGYNTLQIHFSDDCHPIVQRFTGTIQYKYSSLMTVIPLCNALRVQYRTNTFLWWLSSHCATLYGYNTVQIQFSDDCHPIVQRFTGTI
jgi:hypothetical protein